MSCDCVSVTFHIFRVFFGTVNGYQICEQIAEGKEKQREDKKEKLQKKLEFDIGNKLNSIVLIVTNKTLEF